MKGIIFMFEVDEFDREEIEQFSYRDCVRDSHHYNSFIGFEELQDYLNSDEVGELKKYWVRVFDQQKEEQQAAERLKEIFEENLGFSVHLSEQDGKIGAELEDWTEGGVDMIMWIHPFTVEEFVSYAESFDVDEAIDLHRQAADYRNAFTHRQSVADFEKWEERLKENIETIKKIEI